MVLDTAVRMWRHCRENLAEIWSAAQLSPTMNAKQSLAEDGKRLFKIIKESIPSVDAKPDSSIH
jgi:hypothetical protein